MAANHQPLTIHDLELNLEQADKCALIGSRFEDIVAELKAVTESYDGKCVSRAETAITNIQADMQSLEEARAELELGQDDTELVMSDDQRVRFQSTLNTIGSMLSEKQCRSEFKDKGFLPILANTVNSISQIAMLSTSPTGIAVGVGGSILSVTLKAITDIFTPKFKWTNEADRKAFLTFNCSYQTVKKKIKDQGVYNLKDYELENLISQTAKELDELKKIKFAEGSIHKQLEEINQEEQKALAEAELARTSIVVEHAVGQDYYLAHKDVVRALEKMNEQAGLLDPSLTQAQLDVRKAQVFSKILAEYQTIQTRIPLIKPNESNIFDTILYQNTKDKLRIFTADNALKLMQIKSEEIAQLKNDLAYSLDVVKSLQQNLYDKNVALLTPVEITHLQNKIASEQEIKAKYDLKRQALINTDQNKYQQEEDYYTDVVNKVAELEVTLAELKAQKTTIVGQERYTLNNAGVENDVTIYNLDRLNSERIYGPIGYSFIRYLVSQSKESLQDFENNKERLSSRMNYLGFEGLSEQGKISYCINMREMQKTYTSSAFPSEMGYDFVVTNMNLFHNLLKDDFVLSSERKELRDHAFSALYARSLIMKYYSKEYAELQTPDQLLSFAENLKYEINPTECVESSGLLSKIFGSKKKCGFKHEHVFFRNSIGREMIKSVVAERFALDIQRKVAKYCTEY